MLDSEVVRISPTRYAAVEIQRRLTGLAAIGLIPLAACLVAGLALSDYRFGLVGLMLVFIAWPGVMAFAWLSLVSAPGVALKIRPQTWSFDDLSAVITYYSYGEESEPVDSVELDFEKLKRFEIRGDFAYFFAEVPTFASKGEYYILPASKLPSGLAQRLTDLLYDKQ